ncbi:MAG: glycoside hydrolase family 3 C-terminal domain-containing protein [Firmicutes bacterium]|nr:glycoside hydrolase family 3 C-terminal domain-containing protein [Bacillota bacterium]
MVDKFENYDLNNLPEQPVPELAELSRQAAAEGIVLLKNDGVLPLSADSTVALLGRAQFDTVISGEGSGGLVNVPYSVNYITALREHGVNIYEPLADMYEDWIDRNPIDLGNGWATRPTNQVEMPLDTSTLTAAAAVADTAIVFINRVTGEDMDNRPGEGGYLLTADERRIIDSAAEHFAHVAVVMNVSTLTDVSFADDRRIGALLYAWNGGMEAGNALADVLCGDVSPSGKLADTVITSLDRCPADASFGGEKVNVYSDDIYVGYRYYETADREAVQYPFGFGLSYTDFDVTLDAIGVVGPRVSVSVNVTNTGSFAGKEVVEVYFSAPQGRLGRPVRELAAFGKTELLQPGESVDMSLEFNVDSMAAFDDGGLVGPACSYVLEAGNYGIFVGTDVRSAKHAMTFTVEQTRIVRTVGSALAPVTPFKRMKPQVGETITMIMEDAPLGDGDVDVRIAERMPSAVPITADLGIKLFDVADDTAEMDKFIAQIPDEQLMCMMRGEGMGSPKVTPGTGSAFGGTTDQLLGFGVPIACATDGPSGLRLDSGANASLLPTGITLACTWNTQLVERLYNYIGVEMRAYKIDTLLGPGVNIHRHPLCGRNFEYFSEDPLLSGKMAAAVTRGIAACGVTGTIKHLAVNNQEHCRTAYDVVVSSRALREIYLRPFEIAVREGGRCAVMTSYNSVNGHWAAGNYDLCTAILRDEWGFDGFVMSDWWAQMNDTGKEPSKQNLAACVRAQNDIYMVVSNASTNPDNMAAALIDDHITRGQLQRNAANICRYLTETPAFERFRASGGRIETANDFDTENMPLVAQFSDIGRLQKMPVRIAESGKYVLAVTYSTQSAKIAQGTISIIVNDHGAATASISGTEGGEVIQTRLLLLDAGHHDIKLDYSDGTLKVLHAAVYRVV